MRYVLLFLGTTLGLTFNAQSVEHSIFHDFFHTISVLDFKHSRELIKKYPKDIQPHFKLLIKLIETKNHDLLSIKADTLIKPNASSFIKVVNLLNQGYSNASRQTNRIKALTLFNKAYSLSLKIKCKPLTKQCLIGSLFVFKKGVTQDSFEFETYLNEYKSLIENPTDTFWYYYYKISLYGQSTSYYENKLENDTFFLKQIKSLDSLQTYLSNNNLSILINQIKGNYYVKRDGVIAKEYYTNALQRLDTSAYFKPLFYRLNIDLARSEAIQGNYHEAISIMHDSKQFMESGNTILNKLNYNFFLSEYHKKLTQYDSAYIYLNNVFGLEKELNYREHNIEVSELEIELQTVEKEKQIFEEQQKKKQNQNIAIGLGVGLIGVTVIGFLLFKNTKRKQLIAEQEKTLETQKLTTVLKEQELTAIDAMIEGQEKERQRIANDLHDDLGGLMANVKMHFNALKDQQSEDLFSKTDKLLDEAYQKVRTVAHAKNSGVIAKQGLLKAVQNMAKKISANNKIKIEVFDHDLESRFENSLELTLFRIIQELITNVIKHAGATEATIHITNHDDSLNIMVEDDGKGFNTKNIAKASGMGIHSIDKRIENLGGTVTIESEKNKGTTVIIDIPS